MPKNKFKSYETEIVDETIIVLMEQRVHSDIAKAIL
jgi:hypothetical protein